MLPYWKQMQALSALYKISGFRLREKYASFGGLEDVRDAIDSLGIPFSNILKVFIELIRSKSDLHSIGSVRLHSHQQLGLQRREECYRY